MQPGLILNIQKYSIQDGPGIRTTVFLKGCPARCWWCHNPESQEGRAEVVVLEGRCIRCGACREVCPYGAEHAAGDTTGQVPPTCEACGECVAACPTGARAMAGLEMTVEEVLREILKDRVFHEESGGGVTLSGGEPLQQFEFVETLLRACRDQGLHTAVDTCGFAPAEDLLALAPITDLFLYDLKFMDAQVHRDATGVSNAPILDNLAALGRVHDNIWIRVPVIPGINDDRNNLEAMAAFLTRIGGVRQVNLLPYHRLGIHKAERLGRTYRLPGMAPPSPERLEDLAAIFSAQGFDTRIGG